MRNIKGDRVKYWISVGAQPSASVHNMLITDKIIEGKKIAKHKIVPTKAEVAPTAPVGEPVAPAVETSPEPTVAVAVPENKPADVSSEALAKEEAPPEKPKQA